ATVLDSFFMSEVGATDRERLLAAARAWIAGDLDEITRRELGELIERDELEEIRERFAAPLEFGTAGLRGVVAAGPARMNRAVVVRTTRGLGDYLVARGARALPVVVGYDARLNSLRFAADA